MRGGWCVLLILLGTCVPASAQVASSGELVENTRAWDGKALTFSGEAIGEAMRRGQMAWIHVNDDAYMWRNIEEGAGLRGYNSGQAIWLSAALADQIRYFGDFAHEGDVVEVQGVFNAACPEHGGDMDIHASALRIVRPGHPAAHVVSRSRLIAASIALLLTGVAAGAWRIVRRRRA